jgi:hypothetical protein
MDRRVKITRSYSAHLKAAVKQLQPPVYGGFVFY